MNLRPIETIGVTETLLFLGLMERIARGECECVRLPERQPSTRRSRKTVVQLRKPRVIVDPLAVFLFEDVHASQPDLPADAIGLTVWVPHGESLEKGFLWQRFLLKQASGEAIPQARPMLITGEGELLSVETGILFSGRSGPRGISEGLSVEIPHGLAALQASMPMIS